MCKSPVYLSPLITDDQLDQKISHIPQAMFESRPGVIDKFHARERAVECPSVSCLQIMHTSRRPQKWVQWAHLRPQGCIDGRPGLRVA
jgi:hypothetical protein